MEHTAEIEWTIDNFERWNKEVHGTCIQCPKYSDLQFNLYPRDENGQEECMTVDINYLEVIPPGELFFLDSKQSLIHSVKVINPNKCRVIRTHGPRMEKVLSLMKNNEENRLILQYRRKNVRDCKFKMRSSLHVVDTTLEIDSDDLVGGERISVFVHKHDGKNQLVELWSVNEGEKTGIQLKAVNSEIRVFSVKTCISFLKSDGVLEKYEENEHLFHDKEPWVVFSTSKKESLGSKLQLSLKIITGRIEYIDLCIGLYFAVHEKVFLSEQKPSEIPAITSDHTEDSTTALINDLMCLYQDQEFSDVQLNCGGVSFPVHKIMLSARSQVFKRLLSSDMREAASGSVDIEDLDASTLARFLTFLYTGAVGEDLTVERALKLYYAADKYEVSSLRRECAKFLYANVAVSNVGEILSLADKHRDNQLTQVSRRFILENFNEVLSSEEWMCLMRREPLLVAEIVTDFAKKNYVKKIDFCLTTEI